MLTDAGLDLIAQAIAGGVENLQVTYVAVGTDATAPAAGDVKLGAELFRKQYTQQTRAGLTVDTELYLAPSEAVGSIREVGWFAGDASAAADSGTLIARVLYSHDKTNLESVQLSFTDTIERAS